MLNRNKNGGRWIINLQKFYKHAELDRLWLEVILCLIGEAFDCSEDINGAVVNIRPRGHKIGKTNINSFIFRNFEINFHFISIFCLTAIWTSNNNQARIISIGTKLRESLKLPDDLRINYEFHKETAFKHGSKAPAFTL